MWPIQTANTRPSYTATAVRLSPTSRIFCSLLWLENDKYAQLKDKASKSCPFFHEIAEDPEYAVLFAKLWEMTKHERIEPRYVLLG